MTKLLPAITINRTVNIPPTHCPSSDPHRHVAPQYCQGIKSTTSLTVILGSIV
jgi:hypothetical protein